MPKEEIGKFYTGDCYIVLYTYHTGERKEDLFLCCWFGKDSIKVIYVLQFEVWIHYDCEDCNFQFDTISVPNTLRTELEFGCIGKYVFVI